METENLHFTRIIVDNLKKKKEKKTGENKTGRSLTDVLNIETLLVIQVGGVLTAELHAVSGPHVCVFCVKVAFPV